MTSMAVVGNIPYSGPVMGGGLRPAFQAMLSASLAVNKGIGTYDFSNDSADGVRSVEDFEGLIHTDILSQEARFQGVRRVRNLLENTDLCSEDLEVGTWSKVNGAVITGPTTFTTSQVISKIQKTGIYGSIPADGTVQIARAEVSVDIACGIRFQINGESMLYTQLTPANGTVVITFKVVASSETLDRFDIQCDTSGVTVTVSKIQVEDVTGQTLGEQGIPSEYVSVGVGTGGAETIDDPGFDDASKWSISAGWAVASGVATAASPSAGATLTQILGAKAGKLYFCSVDVNITTGSWKFEIGGTLGVAQTTTGPYTYTEIIRATVDGQIELRSGGTPIGTFDNFSVTELDHGSNVDGVKYFDYHNTLAVVDNVVYGTGGRGVELAPDLTIATPSNFSAGVNFTHLGPGLNWKCYFTGDICGSFDSYASYAITVLESEEGELYEHTLVIDNMVNPSDSGANITAYSGGSSAGSALQNIKSNGTYVFLDTAEKAGGDDFWLGVRKANSTTDVQFDIVSWSIKKITLAESYAPGTKFGRRVDNTALITHSEDFAHTDWVKINANIGTDVDDPFGGTSAQTLVATAANGTMRRSDGGDWSAHAFVSSIYLRRRVGTGSVNIYTPNGSGLVDVSALLSTIEWRRFSTSGLGGAALLRHRVLLGVSGDEVDIFGAMVEDRTNDTDQINPAEYVSNGEDVFPYSGTGFDGVAEFPRSNPNSVAANVVSADQITYPRTPGDGVLMEGPRTNEILYSNDLVASWGESNIVEAANTTVLGIDGLPAQLVEAIGTGALSHRFFASPIHTTLSANQPVCFSVRVKAKELTGIRLALYNPTDSWYGSVQSDDLDVAQPTVTTLNSPIDYGIIREKDGWWRIWVSGTAVTAGAQNAYLYTRKGSDVWDASLVPNEGIYVGLAQYEEGIFPSSYIPTSGAPVDRLADLLFYDPSNFTGLLNDISILLAVTPAYLGGTVLEARDLNAGLDMYKLSANSIGNPRHYRSADGVSEQSVQGQFAPGKTTRTGVLYESTGARGITPVTDGVVDIGPSTLKDSLVDSPNHRFSVGHEYNSVNHSNSAIKDVEVYAKVLSDKKMVEKTS